MNAAAAQTAPQTAERLDPPPSAAPLRHYIVLSLVELLAVWWIYKQQGFRTKLLAVRVYGALLELATQRRLAGTRCCGPVPLAPLLVLVGRPPEKQVRAALHDLRRYGILPADLQSWELFTRLDALHDLPRVREASPIALTLPQWLATFKAPGRRPRRTFRVPRWCLKALAQQTAGKPVVAAVFLACLFRFRWERQDHAVHGTGGLAPSWVATRFGVSKRGVQLVIASTTAIGQMQRFATPWWSSRQAGGKTLLRLDLAARGSRISSQGSLSGSCISSQSPLKSCDPLRDLKSSDPAAPSPDPVPPAPDAGVFDEQPDSPLPAPCAALPSPLRPRFDVQLETLRDNDQLQGVYTVCCQRGWLIPGEASRLKVWTAAEHVLRSGALNPGGLFVALVRGLCQHPRTGGWYDPLTQEDEDRARARLGAAREPCLSAAAPVPQTAPAAVPALEDLSADAVLVAEVVRLWRTQGARGDPLRWFKCGFAEGADWTRARWERAQDEARRAREGPPRGKPVCG